jgi:tellurite resistance protein TehA-like permease
MFYSLIWAGLKRFKKRFEMGEIHGSLYLIIGLLVVVGSLIVNLQNKSYKFILFFIAGAGMVVWGIVKLAGSKTGKKTQIHQVNPQPQFIKYCSRCGTALQGFQQFCHMCGGRLFHRR